MTRDELIEAGAKAHADYYGDHSEWDDLNKEAAAAVLDAVELLIRADTAARISDAISDTFGRDERALDCADLATQMFPVRVQP